MTEKEKKPDEDVEKYKDPFDNWRSVMYFPPITVLTGLIIYAIHIYIGMKRPPPANNLEQNNIDE